MKRVSKKVWITGLVVLALGLIGAVAVPALAQPGGQPPVNTGVYLDNPTLVRLAQVLGLTPEELTKQLQTGKTLAAIAETQKVPVEKLVQAIISPHADQVALRVRYGYLTQEEADQLLKAAQERATFLLGQNLAAGDGNGYLGNCDDMMASWNGTGHGLGGMMNGSNSMMGPGGMMNGSNGMMGSGMMGGWGGYGPNRGTTPNQNSTTGQLPNGFIGRGGMMGGGMMGSW